MIIMNYEKHIKELQKRYTNNVKLPKAQSKAILLEVCPLCKFNGRCEIDTKIYGKEYKLCKIKSCDTEHVWVRITEDRPKVNIGDRFGKLVIESKSEYDNYGNPRWHCKCDCGNNKIILGINLINGNTKSCGCKQGSRNDLTSIANSNIIICRKKNRYTIGSSRNPDGSLHVMSAEHHSKTNCYVDKLVEREDTTTHEIIRYYIRDTCYYCRSFIKYNSHGFKQCEECGTIN